MLIKNKEIVLKIARLFTSNDIVMQKLACTLFYKLCSDCPYDFNDWNTSCHIRAVTESRFRLYIYNCVILNKDRSKIRKTDTISIMRKIIETL